MTPDPIRQGRPPQGATPLPTMTVSFVLSQDDCAAFIADADAAGISMSTWLRRAVARELARKKKA